MTASALDRVELEALLAELGERTALVFPPERIAAVESGVARAMERARCDDLSRYRRRLESESAVFDDLVSELTIGETYFFREPLHFDFIRREVLPEIRARRGASHVIRAWSAACASGEEAYSLAMLFEEAGLGGAVQLLATDISRAALAKALRGSYRAWSLRGAGAARAKAYLRAENDAHVVKDSIRRRVTFEHLNLSLDNYPSFGTRVWGMDLILCRNVLIYFDREAIAAVARRLFASLADGGWLLTASSDPPLGGYAPFHTVVTEGGVLYRKPMPQAAAQASPVPLARESARRHPAAPRTAAPARPLAEDATAAALRLRALANRDPEEALRSAITAQSSHPLSAEIHFLAAALLMELGRTAEAAEAVRRVLYLDRSLAIAHFVLGSIRQRLGDVEGARRAYRNARELGSAIAAPELVPLGDGESAGDLVAAAESQLAILETDSV